MAATTYKVAHWGSPVGKSAMGSIHVHVSGIAKMISGGEPRAVANELVCGELARVAYICQFHPILSL